MDTQAIKSPLNQFVKIVVQKIKPEKIILYGSFARGEASSWSDIDLAVIGDTDIAKIIQITDSVKSPFCFDIRVYRSEQFNNIRPLSIYSEMKREGVTLYSKS